MGQRIALGILLVAFALYSILLVSEMGAYAGGADESGYANAARLFGQGSSEIKQMRISGLDSEKLDQDTYIPLGFVARTSETMVPTYSTGLPLVIAGAAKLISWKYAAHAVMFAFSLLGLLVTAWLAREWGLSWFWSWISALLLALSPLYLMFSLQLMSDVPALFFATLSVVLAWKSRAHTPFALAAGIVLAYAVLVRQTNALMILPVAVCLGLSWRRWVLLGLGGLPCAIFFCLYNRFNYGGPFATGYSNIRGWFGPQNILPSVLNYARWLPVFLTPLGILFLGLPFLTRRAPRRALVLVIWISCILGFYSLHVGTQENRQILRYLLPATPAMLVAGVWVFSSWLQAGRVAKLRERLVLSFQRKFHPALAPVVCTAAILFLVFFTHYLRHDHRWFIHLLPPVPLLLTVAFLWMRKRHASDYILQLRSTCMALLIVLIVGYDCIWNMATHSLFTRENELAYPTACAWAKEHLPANAVIYTMQTSGAILYYTPFTLVRWDYVTPGQQGEIEKACAASDRPIYALLFAFEVEKLQRIHFLDGWTQIATLPHVTCWRLDHPGKAAATQ